MKKISAAKGLLFATLQFYYDTRISKGKPAAVANATEYKRQIIYLE